MSFPSALETLLENGTVVVRGLIKFQFGTGTYGVWNGIADTDFAPNSFDAVQKI